jgi:protein required for attachment to host cells
MQPNRTWVVVADGANARILLHTEHSEGLRRLNVDFSADHHSHEEQKFLSRLAKYLGQASEKHEFEHLIIVAPATALGDLRQDFSKNLHNRVIGEVVHDYTHQNDEFIYRHIKDKLPL